MNKKIEDAAKEHVYNLVPPVNVGFMDTEEAVNYQAIRSFKAGAECALREAIEILGNEYDEHKLSLKFEAKQAACDALDIAIQKLEQLLSDANKDV